MVTEMEDFDPAFVGGFRENHATIYPVVNTDSLSTFLGEFQFADVVPPLPERGA